MSAQADGFPWTLTEREKELAELFIAIHGLVAFLDHLGLDGVANQVAELEREARRAKALTFAIKAGMVRSSEEE